MMGPPPKEPSTLARRNVHSTKAILRAVPDAPIPDLPEHDWHPETLSWWHDLWRSPMGPEYTKADQHGLVHLAYLVDAFNKVSPDHHGARIKLAAEIRQQRSCFGLTPIDRRRLQWTIDQGEAAEQRTKARREAKTAPVSTDGPDPRAMLG